ncbi:MAG: hypothetical protein R2912_08630 [Eubacteriales bacterium]
MKNTPESPRATTASEEEQSESRNVIAIITSMESAGHRPFPR